MENIKKVLKLTSEELLTKATGDLNRLRILVDKVVTENHKDAFKETLDTIIGKLDMLKINLEKKADYLSAEEAKLAIEYWNKLKQK